MRDDRDGGAGRAAALFVGGLAVAVSVVCFSFVRRVRLPYVPATPRQIANVEEALRGRSGALVDLGSGDGRVVVAAAKGGFRAHGVELNPWLVLYSRLSARLNGVADRATFERRDLWEVDLGAYDNVVVFGVDEMMAPLREKLAREAAPGTVVAACRFPLTGATPFAVVGHGTDAVRTYRAPV